MNTPGFTAENAIAGFYSEILDSPAWGAEMSSASSIQCTSQGSCRVACVVTYCKSGNYPGGYHNLCVDFGCVTFWGRSLLFADYRLSKAIVRGPSGRNTRLNYPTQPTEGWVGHPAKGWEQGMGCCSSARAVGQLRPLTGPSLAPCHEARNALCRGG